MKSKADIIKATEAHTALCLFEAVVRILESGDIKSRRQAAAQTIIAVCKAEQQRCLADYDAAVGRPTQGTQTP